MARVCRIPHLQPVSEKHDLHASVVCVVVVGHSVDDSFGHNLFRNFIGRGSLDASRPSANRSVDLAKHEVHRLIDQFEGCALVNLIGCGRMDFGFVKGRHVFG